MMTYPMNETETLRAEIAAAAARMIAEDGADYATAKRKAARQLLGNQKVKGDILPDNNELEQAVREYNELFLSDSQPQRLLQLRNVALKLMRELERFHPFVVGAVLNGTAGEHSEIYLHLYPDNTKEVAMYLLNQNIQFDVSETQGGRNENLETLSFLYDNEGVHLVLYDQELHRGKSHERASLAELQAITAASQASQ